MAAVAAGVTARAAPAAPTAVAATLATARAGSVHTVRQLRGTGVSAEWRQQLQDLGFLPGERVAVLRRALLGGDPLVVRVGSSTYALRRAEADCVLIE